MPHNRGMRFQRGTYYPHPPRGKAHEPYTLSPEALLQRRNNLKRTRIRSDRESLVVRLFIWQARFESGPHLSQRTLARQLHVSPSYVCKVQKQSAQGFEALVRGQRVSLDDLEKARRFTERIREEGCLHRAAAKRLSNAPRVMTTDEAIAEQRRYAEEWKRKNPPRYDNRRRISVPIPR
jgi:hypothetical protein